MKQKNYLKKVGLAVGLLSLQVFIIFGCTNHIENLEPEQVKLAKKDRRTDGKLSWTPVSNLSIDECYSTTSTSWQNGNLCTTRTIRYWDAVDGCRQSTETDCINNPDSNDGAVNSPDANGGSGYPPTGGGNSSGGNNGGSNGSGSGGDSGEDPNPYEENNPENP